MTYDLVIRNGMVVDGSGIARYRADVGVKDGIITTIGKITSPAKEVIDADGQIVSPGFVDGHTHMDAQIFWDPIGTSSCYHGVTSVVMGNCGFTLAPCREKEVDFVFRNLERAEDISREAMKAGIKWRWETFPEFLDVLDALPKGINYSGYLGHSALRTYVMGERAFTEAANEEDLKAMVRNVQDAVRAGAMGFSTSISINHETSDDRPVASRLAQWSEIDAIVHGMGKLNSGIMEIAGNPMTIEPAEALAYLRHLKDLSRDSGRPVTFGMFAYKAWPDRWRPYFDVLEEAAAEGARMFVQVHTRAINVLLSFETQLPFDTWELWRDIRKLPLAQQKAALQNPDTRRKLVEIAQRPYTGPALVGAVAKPPKWDAVFIMDSVAPPYRSMAEVARERGTSPEDLLIDLALERDMKLFLIQPGANEDEREALDMMKHPRAVVTFSDAGAHVSQIMDNSLQTHLLSYWVRQKQAFTLEQAVRKLSYEPATLWGFHDRGLVREGMAADLIVFDPDTIAPCMPEVVTDLPAGAKRLRQKAVGMTATVVNGQIMLKNNVPTGALPGRLLRNKLPG